MTIIDPGQQTPPVVEDPNAPAGVPVPVTEPEPKSPAVEGNGKGSPDAKPVKTFTAEDIEKARKEEKDKLYKSIEDMKGQLSAVTKEREEREKAAKAAEKAAADAAKAKAEEEMSAKELLAQKEAQWEEKFTSLQTQRERDQAILEQERRFGALADYRAQRMTVESEHIMPELLDFIGGNTEDEIEASIAKLKDKTATILGNAQQAMQQYRQQMPGTKITQPPVGPVEQQQNYETLSADDIRGMGMETYSKRRQALLGAASENRNKGLFG